jgi:probable phosphoglycerate mutase
MSTGGPRPGSPTAPLVVYFDGASRGNPGPASYGVFSPSGIAIGQKLGITTNNVAEWRGFVAALGAAREAGAENVEIRADSELVLKQFRGESRVKAAHLAGYLDEARRLARSFSKLTVQHVPRAQNRHADALANAALDGKPVGRRPEKPGQGSLFSE